MSIQSRMLRISIFCSLLTLAIIMYYLRTNTKKSTSSLHIYESLVKPSDGCELSMNESADWFCESNLKWQRRKINHYKQHKRNKHSLDRTLYFQNNWEPTMHCEFEQRLGNVGEGGKWICDIHRFRQMNKTNIIVYSFGSNGDFSFERAIKEELPNAEIHTFDINLYGCPVDICTFHQAYIGDGKFNNTKSIRKIINELGHKNQEIDILKVDIEGSEFMLFEDLFKSSNVPFIRQILFEIHLSGRKSVLPSRRTHDLFTLFYQNNYAIFHKEVNLYDPYNTFEYALLRLNPAFFIPPF